MFNKDFYPTPPEVIDQMISGLDLNGKVVLEPSAGKGNIVDALKMVGAKVIVCENNEDLAQIVKAKGTFLKNDFLEVLATEVSHIDYIIMNPPFSSDEHHILHAWNIAPKGCQIISLCNYSIIEDGYSRFNRELKSIIKESGSVVNLGDCFSIAERKTKVDVGLVNLFKPGVKEDNFEGFFMDEDPEEIQENGIMPYNAVREIVQRYINAIKLYDDVLDNAVKMNDFIGDIGSKVSFICTQEEKQTSKEEFIKQLQKDSWKWVFSKMDMGRYLTEGLKADINKFVEQQQNVPFTMKNIYQMFRIIVGTHGDRMKNVLIEVFDQLTKYYNENRYEVEGWKTNSHYMLNKKFILPYVFEMGWGDKYIKARYNGNGNKVNDLTKALCYITGTQYKREMDLDMVIGYNSETLPNTWVDTEFFEIKGFKKGTMHAKFKDHKLWEKYNRLVAEAKGFDLPESV